MKSQESFTLFFKRLYESIKQNIYVFKYVAKNLILIHITQQLKYYNIVNITKYAMHKKTNWELCRRIHSVAFQQKLA